MTTDGTRVWQLEIRSSVDLHHVYTVRRRRLSRQAHRSKVWTSPALIGTRILRCPRQPTSVPCCCRFGSIRVNDVGHAATGCKAVAVVVGSPQQLMMASFTGGSGELLHQVHRHGSSGDGTAKGARRNRPLRAMPDARRHRAFLRSPAPARSWTASATTSHVGTCV